MKFSFSDENLEQAQKILLKYPYKQSALVPILDLAQRQIGGYLSNEAIEYVGNYLDLPYIKVLEVVSFYSMFKRKKVGKYNIQICTTTPCWLKGCKEIMSRFQELLRIQYNEADGMFSIEEVECLGACINAPVVQINDEYKENLSVDDVEKLINLYKERA